MPLDELDSRLESAGFVRKGAGLMRLSAPAGWSEPALPAGYEIRDLRTDDPQTLPLIRAFTERCDPADVEEADLDQLDDLDDAAMTAVVHNGEVVAYAGGGTWPWDPAFADIGILVAEEHRRRGLAAASVVHCCRTLQADGRIPLYRHAVANDASGATADRV